jgi:DnaJ homologue, subfamily C, member 28, conserved domain
VSFVGDEIIKQWIRRVEATRELERDPRFGKPLELGDGYLDTPEELRMAYKMLKDAGYLPAEVELLKTLAARKAALETERDPARRAHLLREVAELQAKIAMMLEGLARKT